MRQIEFVYPDQTHVVSVTGTRCDLNCKHCNGSYLKHMFPVDSVPKGKKSVLVSGGFNFKGELELDMETLEKLKKFKGSDAISGSLRYSPFSFTGLKNLNEVNNISSSETVI